MWWGLHHGVPGVRPRRAPGGPCAHALCSRCAPRLSRCPLCRATLRRFACPALQALAEAGRHHLTFADYLSVLGAEDASDVRSELRRDFEAMGGGDSVPIRRFDGF